MLLNCVAQTNTNLLEKKSRKTKENLKKNLRKSYETLTKVSKINLRKSQEDLGNSENLKL